MDSSKRWDELLDRAYECLFELGELVAEARRLVNEMKKDEGRKDDG